MPVTPYACGAGTLHGVVPHHGGGAIDRRRLATSAGRRARERADTSLQRCFEGTTYSVWCDSGATHANMQLLPLQLPGASLPDRPSEATTAARIREVLPTAVGMFGRRFDDRTSGSGREAPRPRTFSHGKGGPSWGQLAFTCARAPVATCAHACPRATDFVLLARSL